ncbi:MAG: hypothetical protein AB1705_22210 [Verrucomicrobiota bacterium]
MVEVFFWFCLSAGAALLFLSAMRMVQLFHGRRTEDRRWMYIYSGASWLALGVGFAAFTAAFPNIEMMAVACGLLIMGLCHLDKARRRRKAPDQPEGN